MSAWSPRPGSDPAAARRRGAVPAHVSLALALALVQAAGAVQGAPARPELRFAPGHRPSPGEARLLELDRAWLAGQPLTEPVVAPADSADLRRWLGRRLRAGRGGGDPAAFAGARGLLSRLRDRWLERGYLGVRLRFLAAPEASAGADAAPAGDAAAGPRIILEPGPPHLWGEIAVEGRDFPGRERLLALTLPHAGDRCDAARWQEGVADLLLALGDRGHPFARWLVRAVRIDSTAATVGLDAVLFPGTPSHLGRVTSNLASARARAFLARASGLRPGALFRESELERARRRLLQRGLYQEIAPPEVYRTDARDTVRVHWHVTPLRKPNRLAVVLGYSRVQEDEGGRFSGQVDLFLPNLAGTGRRLAAGWSDDGRDRSHLGFAFLEPLAFGTPLDTELQLDQEVFTDQYTRFQADLRWRLPVVAEWGIEVGLGWDRSTFPAGDIERTTRWRARGAFLHRRLDPARSGWEGVFALETARRQATTRRDTTGGVADTGPVGEAERQRLLELELSGEAWLAGTLSLAGRSSFREVSGEGAEILLSEQYRFGGARSVRGYREDEFRGERIWHGSMELRVGRPGRSRLYTFYDLGYFEFTAPSPTETEPERRVARDGWVRGFGLGLETRTPGGDISLAIGFPGTVNFDDAKLHVVLLEAF
jgi:outer membrane protein assembly factor BamA